MPKKEKKKEKKPQKEQKKEQTTSGTSDTAQTDNIVADKATSEKVMQEHAFAEAYSNYGPLLETIGVTKTHLEMFMKLPQILDGMAGRIIAIEKHVMTGTVSAARPRVTPRPTAPGLSSGQSTIPGAAQSGWLQNFIMSPDGQKLVTALINAFSGGGGDASSTSVEIAKEIEKGVREKAISQVRAAFKVSQGFKDKVDAGNT